VVHQRHPVPHRLELLQETHEVSGIEVVETPTIDHPDERIQGGRQRGQGLTGSRLLERHALIIFEHKFECKT
jgi:hypothetical protein